MKQIVEIFTLTLKGDSFKAIEYTLKDILEAIRFFGWLAFEADAFLLSAPIAPQKGVQEINVAFGKEAGAGVYYEEGEATFTLTRTIRAESSAFPSTGFPIPVLFQLSDIDADTVVNTLYGAVVDGRIEVFGGSLEFARPVNAEEDEIVQIPASKFKTTLQFYSAEHGSHLYDIMNGIKLICTESLPAEVPQGTLEEK